jgi:hypothetical protein
MQRRAFIYKGAKRHASERAWRGVLGMLCTALTRTPPAAATLLVHAAIKLA